MHKHIQQYLDCGYQPLLDHRSLIGSEILIHQTLNRIVKFGQDSAYHFFVEYARGNPHDAFPVFYKHEMPLGPFLDVSNEPYTLTEMELLAELSDGEARGVIAWVNASIEMIKNGGDVSGAPDPFDLAQPFLNLREIARQNGLGLDLRKSHNFMSRQTTLGRRIVITDPFS